MARSSQPATGGVELGYAEITAGVVQTGVGNSDVTGLSVTVTVGNRPILVTVQTPVVVCSADTGIGEVRIMEGAVVLNAGQNGRGTGASRNAVQISARLTPSPGQHTYKVNLTQITTGNTTMSAAATTPAFIQVLEV